MGIRRLRPGSLALTGIAGAVLAHAVGYLAVFPDGYERAIDLHATGHDYWPLAVTAAVATAAASFAAAVWRGVQLVRGPRENTEGTAPWVRLAKLAAWQVLLFAGMESLERVGAGMSPSVLLHSPAFVVGLGLQVAVAWAALGLTLSVERLAVRLAGALRRRPRHVPETVHHRLDRQRLPRILGWSLSRSRAPPALVGR